jgi:hypothetical protein
MLTMVVIILYKNGLLHPYVINTPLLTLCYTDMFGPQIAIIMEYD